MGYAKINNLYKCKDILEFKRAYALCKVHGSSSHLSWKNNELRLFSGGSKYEEFIKIFDLEALKAIFIERFTNIDCTLYGEAYGGKMQKMSHTYGKELRFIGFEARIRDSWLDVPSAEDVFFKFNLEFVPYKLINTTLEEIDAERDADSIVAIRRGMGPGHMREGIVLRPPIEVIRNDGSRIMAKHKRPEFAERKHTPKVLDENALKVVSDANAIAADWVTHQRLLHILDKLPEAKDMEQTSIVIRAMIKDIYIEGQGEIVESKAVETAIGRETAKLWKEYVRSKLYEN